MPCIQIVILSEDGLVDIAEQFNAGWAMARCLGARSFQILATAPRKSNAAVGHEGCNCSKAQLLKGAIAQRRLLTSAVFNKLYTQ